MNTTTIVLGALAGLGVLLIAAGLVPARPSLAAALAGLREASRRADTTGGVRLRLLSAPLRALGLPRPRIREDLAALDRPVATHLADQMLAVLAGLVLPPLAVAMLTTGSPFGPGTPVWVSLAGGFGGWLLADRTVHAEAQRRRAELRHALSAVLDLVVISLAAGAGLEQALDDACADTNGWAAARLNHAVATSRLLRVPPWHTLGRLGDDTGVVELQELAATMSLAGAEGARIRTSLTARATTLRAHEGNAMEAQANSATERMGLPVMVLALAYMTFLLYPAIAAITKF